MSDYKNCEKERGVEASRECLLLAWEGVGLCRACWLKFLDCENKPELADKLHKWFHGNYVNNKSAEKRIIAKINDGGMKLKSLTTLGGKEVYFKEEVVARDARIRVKIKQMEADLVVAKGFIEKQNVNYVDAKAANAYLGFALKTKDELKEVLDNGKESGVKEVAGVTCQELERVSSEKPERA